MGKIADSKIIIGSEPSETRKRSERVVKRKAFLVDEGSKRKIKKDVVPKTDKKMSLKGKSNKTSKPLLSEAANKKMVEASLKEQMDQPHVIVSKTQSVASSTQSIAAKKSVEKPLKQPAHVTFEGSLKQMSVKSIQSTSEMSTAVPMNEEVNELPQVKRGRKTKMIKYEIDCSGINMDITNFRKDLWNRAKLGKLNSAKNVRIKQTGNIIYLTSRSYVSKKCIRSNIHFLTTMYFKKKKIDREVHVVGDKNAYKLIHK